MPVVPMQSKNKINYIYKLENLMKSILKLINYSSILMDWILFIVIYYSLQL